MHCKDALQGLSVRLHFWWRHSSLSQSLQASCKGDNSVSSSSEVGIGLALLARRHGFSNALFATSVALNSL
jgi:hypothetical protein